jgi:hypothetical protein
MFERLPGTPRVSEYFLRLGMIKTLSLNEAEEWLARLELELKMAPDGLGSTIINQARHERFRDVEI